MSEPMPDLPAPDHVQPKVRGGLAVCPRCAAAVLDLTAHLRLHQWVEDTLDAARGWVGGHGEHHVIQAQQITAAIADARQDAATAITQTQQAATAAIQAVRTDATAAIQALTARVVALENAVRTGRT